MMPPWRRFDDVVKRSAARHSRQHAAYNKSIPVPDLDNLTMEVWDKIIAVNLTGRCGLTKGGAPVMKAQGRGRIVNISSVAGSADRLLDRLCGGRRRGSST